MSNGIVSLSVKFDQLLQRQHQIFLLFRKMMYFFFWSLYCLSSPWENWKIFWEIYEKVLWELVPNLDFLEFESKEYEWVEWINLMNNKKSLCR